MRQKEKIDSEREREISRETNGADKKKVERMSNKWTTEIHCTRYTCYVTHSELFKGITNMDSIYIDPCP